MSEAIVFENDIPLPARVTGRPPVYHWQDMEAGQSFFVPGHGPDNVAGYLNREAKKVGKSHRFSQRKEGDGLRVWRVA